jgi:two-component system response regulator YesN
MLPQSPHFPAVLVVDDEPDALIILRRLLRDLTSDYDIISMQSGLEALTQLDRHPVPLLITDYSMLGMNGLQLAASVKARSPQTRVMVITGYTIPEQEKKAWQQYADYFLRKPFALGRFEQLVCEALNHSSG